tara:strand:+ start:40 stop:747 length:708 start_codon:yes stop_codon:yes gene_type:complete
MKEPIKVVMLLASDQTYQVKKGEYFINDSREHSWGKLELLRAERVTSHGHVWDGDSIKPYIHYLYITVSNDVEGIKDGDWMIRGDEQPTKVTPDFYWDFGVAYRKIISTNDPKLKLKHYNQFNSCCREESECHCNIPQVPQSFLKEFVANPDGEYEVEYDCYYVKGNYMNKCSICEEMFCHTDKLGFICPSHPVLKLNQDNEVNITYVGEKMYTRDELDMAYQKGFKDAMIKYRD